MKIVEGKKLPKAGMVDQMKLQIKHVLLRETPKATD
jgi:hypothetical protein